MIALGQSLTYCWPQTVARTVFRLVKLMDLSNSKCLALKFNLGSSRSLFVRHQLVCSEPLAVGAEEWRLASPLPRGSVEQVRLPGQRPTWPVTAFIGLKEFTT